MTDDEFNRLSESCFVVDRTTAVFVLFFPDGGNHVQRLTDSFADRLRTVFKDFSPDECKVCVRAHSDGIEVKTVREDGETSDDLLAEWDDAAKWSLVASVVSAANAESFRLN